MTCINCPIEVTEIGVYMDGIYTKSLYRGEEYGTYSVWRRPANLNFFTYLTLISHIAKNAVEGDQDLRLRRNSLRGFRPIPLA